MKTSKLLSLLALCGALCAVSCKKESTTPDPTPEKKSDECRLLKLVAVTASGEFEANIYSNEKVAEFVYLLDYKDALKSVTLKAEISDKAATDLQSDKVYNLFEDNVSFTITAEDGTHTSTWKVECNEAQVSISCDLASQNVPGKFGINAVSPAGSSVAFCGTDKIATINGEVYDFEANLLGTLNREGLPEGAVILNINNDVNGVVIASVCYDKEGNPTTNNDDIKYGYVYAWKDGYDKAPVCIYNNAESKSGNLFGYMSCGGDVNGDFLLCTIFGGRGADQCFHVFEYHGDLTAPKWNKFETNYVTNDGNWGAMVSPASGSIEGTFFIGDSNGANKGYHVYTRDGIANNGEDVTLYGTTKETVPGIADAGIPEGNNQYGNYSTGNIKAFMYNGSPCVAAATTGWPQVYLTIQTNDPSDEENHYISKTQYFDASAVIPSVAYVYDRVNDKGQVLLLGGTLVIARYEISRIPS